MLQVHNRLSETLREQRLLAGTSRFTVQNEGATGLKKVIRDCMGDTDCHGHY